MWCPLLCLNFFDCLKLSKFCFPRNPATALAWRAYFQIYLLSGVAWFEYLKAVSDEACWIKYTGACTDESAPEKFARKVASKQSAAGVPGENVLGALSKVSLPFWQWQRAHPAGRPRPFVRVTLIGGKSCCAVWTLAVDANWAIAAPKPRGGDDRRLLSAASAECVLRCERAKSENNPLGREGKRPWFLCWLANVFGFRRLLI
jgi:hypothetical protein